MAAQHGLPGVAPTLAELRRRQRESIRQEREAEEDLERAKKRLSAARDALKAAAAKRRRIEDEIEERGGFEDDAKHVVG